ncbi:hypothetical protein XENOCAPTIV_021119, partial [Xenoophorus captivus]
VPRLSLKETDCRFILPTSLCYCRLQCLFSNLLKEYEKGRTPNPDILCNKHIKFNHFHKKMKRCSCSHTPPHPPRCSEIDSRSEIVSVRLCFQSDRSFFQHICSCQTQRNSPLSPPLSIFFSPPAFYASAVKLCKGADLVKDQTFFLSQISQDALRQTLFPLSGLTKDFVKKMAAEAGFHHVLKKKEV